MRPSATKKITAGSLALFLLAVHAVPGMSQNRRPALRVLVIDGQSNHDWKQTTPVIQQILEGTGRFEVEVATTPPAGGEMDSFQPRFFDFDVVISNYNGEPWSPQTRQQFVQYVASGGGFVCIHASNNAFPEWKEYNRIIGLGGWGGRDHSHGPYVSWVEAQSRVARDRSRGPGGSRGHRAPFEVVVRDQVHPITRGLPLSFLQTEDELYANLRGPAENFRVLATGYSDPRDGGSGKHEPVLFTVQYGDGRVFQTTLGHDVKAMQGVAFQETLQRGTEWAATGDVTFPVVSEAELSRSAPSRRDPGEIVPDEQLNPPNFASNGWKRIFNGENLDGWIQKNGTATFQVEGQEIVGRTAPGSPNTFLCTKEAYSDFELTFEVKCDVELNSGVQIRSASNPEFKNGRVHGPQIEIENSPGESGYIYSEGTGRGWITTPQYVADAYVNGQWNRFSIRAYGDRIQTWINGRPVADIRHADLGGSGFIGLQVHEIPKDQGPYEVRWRDLRVRPLGTPEDR